MARSNEEWLSALQSVGPERDGALADLRAQLMRGLQYGLASRHDVRPTDLEDFAQDALLRILDNLDTFRGESQFMTWAQKVAIRVAFSALRRRRWRDVPLQKILGEHGIEMIPPAWVEDDPSPERQALQRLALEKLREAIADGLTEKQRQAMVAVRLCGMPIEVVAEQMNTNRNALYKLLHDAKRRLKRTLEAEQMPAEEILGLFA